MFLHYEWKNSRYIKRSSTELGKRVVGCHVFTLSSIMVKDKNRSQMNSYMHVLVMKNYLLEFGIRHFFRRNESELVFSLVIP